MRDAISKAGGFADYADKSSIYVIKANGTIKVPGRSIFSNNVKLDPGDTIVIPRKIVTTSPLLAVLAPITQILSNLAFTSAALNNLDNN